MSRESTPLRRIDAGLPSLEASTTEPGHVLLRAVSEKDLIVVHMDPHQWNEFCMEMYRTAIEAGSLLKAACLADNETNPNLS